MSLVTIATFYNYFNIHVIKGRLESEGITAYVKDEYSVTANAIYGAALGGIKLQVNEDDVNEAHRILVEMGYLSPQPVQDVPVKRTHSLLRFLLFFFAFIILLGFIYWCK